MNPVQKIKITKTAVLYKDGEAANSIELAYNDTNAFGVVVAKSQEALGKDGIYIQPDFCLPKDLPSPIFDSYIAPDGNPNKSRLGKQNRIRAIKFNFSLENSMDPVFSMGIFLTKEILLSYYPSINFDTITEEELTELLQITKYEEPEKVAMGMTKGDLPLGMYATDETNSANLVGHINKVLPHEVYGTVKADGCLDKDTMIETLEDGLLSIKEICETKYNGLVKSYNIETNETEFKKIKNHSTKTNINNWFLITLENGKELKVTENHYIWLNDLKCYRQVKDLKINDDLLV